EAVDEIAAVPGVDGIYVGPSDLAISLGVDPAAVIDDRVHLDAVARVQAACARHGKLAAIHTAGPEHARLRVAAGFGMCTLSTDLGLLHAGALADLARARA